MRQAPQLGQLRKILTVIAAAAVVRLWLMPLWNSFWLDETLTVWAIRDGFWNLFHAVPMMLQPVAFCMVEWLIGRLGGFDEATLRLPSLAAAIGALYTYYRIGAEFIDRTAGLTLAALYITLSHVAIEVPNARPYSLALLAESAALLWLLRWLRDGRLWDGIWWIICAVAAGYLHPFFFMALPLEGGFVLWRIYRRSFVKAWQLVVCVLVGMALLAPAIPQLVVISKQARILSWTQQPTLLGWLPILTPIYVLPAVVLLVLLEWLDGRRPRWIASRPLDVAVLGALMLVVPMAISVVLSRWTYIQVFDMRYLLPTAPGVLLLWGWLLHRIDSPFIREMSLACGLAASMVITGGLSAVPDYRQEDWRSAVRSLPESGTILVYSGLVEARRLGWLQQPERWSYLMAPVLAYRQNVQPADAFVIPFAFDQPGQEYLGQLIAARMAGRDRVTVVTRQSFAGPEWGPWVSERLERLGFLPTRTSAYGRVRVEVFQRSSPQCGLRLLRLPPHWN